MAETEPERYYEWMLWKMRQEDRKENERKDDGVQSIKQITE